MASEVFKIVNISPTYIKAVCDTLSNDTSSNEPFRLKVTSSKWHFVDWAHCRKMVSSNSFDEKKFMIICQ